MSSIKPQRQQELFDEFVIRERKKARFFGALKLKKPLFPQHRLNLSVSYEVLIIGLIGLILAASIVFSLGVERGRGLELAKLPLDAVPSVNEAVSAETTEKTAETEKAAEPPPKEAQPQRAASVASEEKAFTVQVASFKTRDLAEKELARLKNAGYSPVVLKKGAGFIVCVGAYAKKELAQQTLKNLRRIYKDCYVRRR